MFWLSRMIYVQQFFVCQTNFISLKRFSRYSDTMKRLTVNTEIGPSGPPKVRFLHCEYINEDFVIILH